MATGGDVARPMEFLYKPPPDNTDELKILGDEEFTSTVSNWATALVMKLPGQVLHGDIISLADEQGNLPDLVFNFKELTVDFPDRLTSVLTQSGQGSSTGTQVQASAIRYAVLNADHVQVHTDSGSVVWVTYWHNVDDVTSVHLFFNNLTSAMMALTAFRKIIYLASNEVTAWLDCFKPLAQGWLPVLVRRKGTQGEADGKKKTVEGETEMDTNDTDRPQDSASSQEASDTKEAGVELYKKTPDVYPNMFCVLDEEALYVMSKATDLKPVHTAFFYKEEGPRVVDSIYSKNEEIMISTPSADIRIKKGKSPVDASTFKSIESGIKTGVRPRPRITYGADRQSYNSLHQKATSAPPSASAGARASVSAGAQASASGGSQASASAHHSADMNWEGTKEKDPDVFSLQALGLAYAPIISEANEAMQMVWVVAETEMTEMMESSLVPSSTIESGGLDPYSVEHLKKCLDEVQEALLDQRYDTALSHLYGTKKTFKENKEARGFIEMPNIEIMKRLFFST